LDSSGGNAMLPPEGISAAGNLFALIVESELKGDSDILHAMLLHHCFST
jgi:hypothetical protein